MEKTPKKMLKSYVDSQHFSSTTEIMDAMKEMFWDDLQQVTSWLRHFKKSEIF